MKIKRKVVNLKTVFICFMVLAALSQAVVFLAPSFQKFKLSTLDSLPEPTTAILKSLDDGPEYLRLEQTHSEVIARVLIVCADNRLSMLAGIVTTPELSSSKLGKATSNYLEIDAERILRAQGSTGAKITESTIWISRELDEKQASALKTANILGAWIEDGGDFRWGAYMTTEGVRNEIAQYVERCR